MSTQPKEKKMAATGTTSTATAGVMIPYFSADRSFDAPDDIVLAVSEPGVEDRVGALRGRFEMVSVAKMVTDLTQAGMLLGVAFAEAPTSCQPLIGRVMLSYQNILKGSRESSHEIVLRILEGLTAHSDALESLIDGDAEGAIEDYRQSVAIAKQMEAISDALYQQSEALCGAADELIVQVLEQKAESDAQLRELRERMGELRAKKAELTSLTDELTEDVDAARKDKSVSDDEAHLAHAVVGEHPLGAAGAERVDALGLVGVHGHLLRVGPAPVVLVEFEPLVKYLLSR